MSKKYMLVKYYTIEGIYLLVFGLLMISVSVSSNAQTATLKTLLDATKCSSEECFLEFIKPHNMCFKTTWSDSDYTYYQHVSCGKDSVGSKRLVINFAKGNDGVFNSSFLTRNGKYSDVLYNELSDYEFKKTPIPQGEGDGENIVWYHSEKYPSLDIMWEIFFDEKEQKVWHIGFVWK